MMMTIAGRASGRRLPRDPDDDVDTRVYVRIPPLPWGAVKVLEIVRRVPRPVPPPRKNVFLMPPQPTDPPPPWVHETVHETVQKTVHETKPARRSMMPWVVFAMCFGIAYGITRDARLRAELTSDLRAAPARIVLLIHSLAS